MQMCHEWNFSTENDNARKISEAYDFKSILRSNKSESHISKNIGVPFRQT